MKSIKQGYNMIKKVLLAVILMASLESPSSAENTPPPAESIKVPSSVADPKQYGHVAPYLVVSCMDFRLRDELEKFMELRVGPDQYDEIVLPGASLGVFNAKYPHWEKTFEDIVRLSLKLHKITTIIFIDHRDCGAYKMLEGENCCDTKAKETHAHAVQFEAVRKLLKEKFPHLKVETLIMGLDGQVETVNPKDPSLP
jgi:hypothetical protein